MSAYKPWRKDTGYGLFFLLLAVGCWFILFLDPIELADFGRAVVFWVSATLILLSVIFVVMSVSAFKQAKKRKFGKEFEEKHTQLILTELKKRRIHAVPNVFIKRFGDVDVVAYPRNRPVPIEIKSFIRWKSDGMREQRAIRQSEMQMAMLNAARGVIWLPQGATRHVVYKNGGQVVFCGNAIELANYISH